MRSCASLLLGRAFGEKILSGLAGLDHPHTTTSTRAFVSAAAFIRLRLYCAFRSFFFSPLPHNITLTCESCVCLEDGRPRLVTGFSCHASSATTTHRNKKPTKQKRRIKMRKRSKKNEAHETSPRLSPHVWRHFEGRRSARKPDDWKAHDGRAWSEEHGNLVVRITRVVTNFWLSTARSGQRLRLSRKNSLIFTFFSGQALFGGKLL